MAEEMSALVMKAKQSDPHAFACLYEMVYEDLYKMALFSLGNKEDAEDTVSETVIEAYTGMAGLRDETAFRGWIFRILSNKCKAKIREYVNQRNLFMNDSVEDMAVQVSSDADVEGEIVNRALLEKAFNVISPEDRLIVTMVVYGGYTSKEISEELQLNRATVRSRYSRSLQKMAEAIKDE